MRAILFLVLFACVTSYAQDAIRKIEVEAVIKGIAKYNGYDSEGIGFGGYKSSQRYRYEELRDKATSRELANATIHSNPVVACYAYEALAERKDSNIFQLLKEHLMDTSILHTHIGCVLGGRSTVPNFMLDISYRNIDLFDSVQIEYMDSFINITQGLSPSIYNYKFTPTDYDSKSHSELINILKENPYSDAIVAIAKYQRESDVKLILERINDPSSSFSVFIPSQVNNPSSYESGIKASYYFPDTAFYSSLKKRLESVLLKKHSNVSLVELLTKSLVNYETQETTLLLIKVLEKHDFEYKVALYDAILDKPYFKDVLDQIDL
jgi:hypothetical protein